MGKYLLSILVSLLIVVFLSPKTLAENNHSFEAVEITKKEDLYEVFVRVRLPAQSETQKFILDTSKDFLADGFEWAKAGQELQNCQKNGTKIICEVRDGSEVVVYKFSWNTNGVIENNFCKSVTAERQNTEIDYITKFSTGADDKYRHIRELKINSLKTDSTLNDLYADLYSDKSFLVLWKVGSFGSDKNELEQVNFVNDPSKPKISEGNGANSGTYRPYSGSFASFSSEAQGQYKITIININKKNVDAVDAKFKICTEDNIESKDFAQQFVSETYDAKDELIDQAQSKNFIFMWNSVIYDNPVTPTYTISPAPTSTHIPPTATPTTNIITSATNPTSTPSPTKIEQRAESKVERESGQNVASASLLKNFKDTGLGQNVLDKTEVLGASDEKIEKYDTESVISDLLSPRKAFGEVGGRNPVINTKSYLNWIFVLFGAVIFVVLIVFVFNRKLLVIFLRKLRIIATISFFVIVFARPTAAQSSPTSIKITDSFTMHGTGLYTGVMNVIYTYVTKSSAPGKYVISRNPDGTGDVDVGNYLQGTVKNVYYASTKSYYVGPVDGSGKHYICPDKTTLAPQDVTSWFPTAGATYQIMFRFITSCQKDFPVSDLYLVFVPDPTPTATATPTSTPTPTPTPFTPFLDLPWDYKSKGLSFSSAATAMTSYFDHEYPLLSASVVGLYDSDDLTRIYEGVKDDFSYSSHDGYDYAKKSKANYGDPQLAAAEGIATLHKDFWAQGNAIYIDHGNRFQTRYYHLDGKDLVTSKTGEEIAVKQGQKIGRIGFTGNVDPKGEGGAHIHFMVVYDKNNDGNFDDNIPDGLTDPYGWMGDAGQDPWENAAFQYPWGTNRTGMRSSYLWKYDLMDESADIGPDGGVLAGDGIKIEVPRISLDQMLNFHMKAVPQPKISTQSADLEVIGSVTEITAKNAEGALVRYFNNPFNIIIDLTTDVAKYYKPGSISIYSSSDGGDTWQKEPTAIDLDEGKAKAEVNHLTLFTLMGEKSDTLPPETTIKASGLGKGDLFRSDVAIDIESLDNADGQGIDYTLFTLDSDSDWAEYMGEIVMASEGAHMIKAFAADEAGNIESPKELRFVIDKTAPEINIRYAIESGEFVFENKEHGTLRQAQGDNLKSIVAEDEAGNTNEMSYDIGNAEGLHILNVLGGVRRGETTNYKPFLYAISGDGDIEFVRSGDEVTRVIESVNGEKIMISSSGEISVYTGISPLQLMTENDRLKID